MNEEARDFWMKCIENVKKYHEKFSEAERAFYKYIGNLSRPKGGRYSGQSEGQQLKEPEDRCTLKDGTDFYEFAERWGGWHQ
jgi:hypothetical protein